ncbi:MAG: hypothetical protein HY826_02065 [Actinobacteria bacterium]|nr:hypothetical protein [Actinomycetota bacterium]
MAGTNSSTNSSTSSSPVAHPHVVRPSALRVNLAVVSGAVSSGWAATTRTTRVRQPNRVYVRRRIVAASLVTSLLAALGLGAGQVLANRGGEPASVPTVRHSIELVVQP